MREFRYEVVVRVDGDVPRGWKPLNEMSLISMTLQAARARESEDEDDCYVNIVGVDARLV